MASFVRLMSGKYQRLRELQSLRRLDVKVTVPGEERPPVCNLCNDVVHVGALQCLCKNELYTCLNHGERVMLTRLQVFLLADLYIWS